MNQALLTQHQPSMTEWFAAIGEIEQSQEFRDEDNRKQDRLIILRDEISLPFRAPEVFPARALVDKSPEFMEVLKARGDESVAIRLTSTDPSLPKLRNRGMILRDCYEKWFLGLDIDFDKYTASIFPNETDIEWSTIFVVNEKAIFGEIVAGRHNQLSQGETNNEPCYFLYDYVTWQWSGQLPEAVKDIESSVNVLHVPDKTLREKLTKELGAVFSHDYLMGYFETTTPKGEGAFFIDYNRLLPKFITTVPTIATGQEGKTVRGMTASPGTARGPVVIVDHESVEQDIAFPEGAVLVCDNTDVRYLPLMRKASAIVTNRGGILSHAAIIARELKKPCVIGTKVGTTTFAAGSMVEVRADEGVVVPL